MKQASFFEEENQSQPLASRMRPASLDQFVGQKHLLAKARCCAR